MSKVSELLKLVSRLESLTGEGGHQERARANDLVRDFMRRAESVDIRARTSNNYPATVAPEDMEAAQTIRNALTAQYKRLGEKARDARLLEIQAEIETVRFALAEANRAAFIEAGQIGRLLTPHQ